ncbi:MAG: OmpH family outer membrane protein [Pirellulales bacterium]
MKAQNLSLAVMTAISFAFGSAALAQTAPAQPAATTANTAQAGAAQPGAPARPTSEVAVVDVGEIFQNHPLFTSRMEGLKKEVQQYEQQLEAKGKELMAMKQELDTQAAMKGAPEYKVKEEAMARKQADLAVEAQGKRKEFIEREAQLYYDTYNDVQKLVQQYAQAYNIQLVLRFNRIEMKAEDRNTILQGVNRPVVYYNSRLDITDAIVTYLKSTAGQGAAATQANRRPAAGAAVPK